MSPSQFDASLKSLKLRRDAWLEPVRIAPSPHCDLRPNPEDVSLLVIHNISLPPGEFGGDSVERFFCGDLDVEAHSYFAEIASLRVSAHCFIDRCGAITQFVPFDQRAWHAGASAYEGRESCNDFSVGIELEGTDTAAYETAQYKTLARLTCLLFQRFPAMRPWRVAGHSDIAPGRKTDPGACFDWAHYHSLVLADQNT